MWRFFSFLALLVFIVLSPAVSHAASFAFSPSEGVYEVGKTVTVTVFAASANASVNAFSGTIKYPKDILEYVSYSTAHTVVNQWLPPGATGPTVRTSDGVINFEGVSIAGYSGQKGEIFRLTFRVKKTGTAELLFSSGSILANDGIGTDVLTAYGKALYTLQPATIVPEKEPVPIVAQEVSEEESPSPVSQVAVPTAFEMQLLQQMSMFMTFMRFVMAAIAGLAVVLIILAIYMTYLTMTLKHHIKHNRD